MFTRTRHAIFPGLVDGWQPRQKFRKFCRRGKSFFPNVI
jgi:hypothetical protein